MTKETAKKIRFLYGLVLSALLLCTGGCLIVACLSIYRSGNAPFTRESIGAWFLKIAIPVWLTVAAAVGGGVLSLVLPADEPRLRGIRDGRVQMERLRQRVNLAQCEYQTFVALQRERLLRRLLCIAAVVLSVVSAVPLAFHLASADHFSPALNESVITTTLAALPFLAVTGGTVLAYLLLAAKSVARETALLKSAMVAGALRKTEEQGADNGKKTARAVLVTRLVILAVAILLIAFGIFNGGMRDTLGKAIKICTECIGLG